MVGSPSCRWPDTTPAQTCHPPTLPCSTRPPTHPPLPCTPLPKVITPGAQQRRIKAWHKHALRFHAVRSFSFAAQRFGGLVDAAGHVRREVTGRLFNKFRKDE